MGAGEKADRLCFACVCWWWRWKESWLLIILDLWSVFGWVLRWGGDRANGLASFCLCFVGELEA